MSDMLLDHGFTQPDVEFTDPQDIIRINDLKLEANEQMLRVRYGRYLMYFLAVMNILYGVGMSFLGDGMAQNWSLFWGFAFAGSLYAGTAALTFRWPLLGLVLGLSLYLVDHGLVMMTDPTRAFEGLLVKIGVLTGFTLAIIGCYKLKVELRALAAMGIPESELQQGRALKEIPRTPQV